MIRKVLLVQQNAVSLLHDLGSMFRGASDFWNICINCAFWCWEDIQCSMFNATECNNEYGDRVESETRRKGE